MALPIPNIQKPLDQSHKEVSGRTSVPTTPRDKPPRELVNVEPSKKMHVDETSFILRKCLTTEHAHDPNIMKFIAEYLLCRDVKQAANAVGLNKRQGENIKRWPDVSEAIRQITEKAALKHGFDAAEVVAKVKEIMDIDIADFQKPDGTFVESLHDLAPEVRRAVKKFVCKNDYGTDPNGMKVVTGKIISVELWDKMKATELLGREKDLFKESKVVKHDLTANMSSVLLESKQRAEERIASYIDVTPKEETDG